MAINRIVSQARCFIRETLPEIAGYVHRGCNQAMSQPCAFSSPKTVPIPVVAIFIKNEVRFANGPRVP